MTGASPPKALGTSRGLGAALNPQIKHEQINKFQNNPKKDREEKQPKPLMTVLRLESSGCPDGFGQLLGFGIVSFD